MANGLPCEDARIVVRDASGDETHNLTTDANHQFTSLVLMGFVNDSAGIVFQGNHSISIQKDAFLPFAQNITMDRSMQIIANLTDIFAPVITSLSIEPNVTGTSSDIIWLNATVSDAGRGGSTISGAEWYISNQHPTISPGSGFTFYALDGYYDEVSEIISIPININNWQVGTQKLWVRAEDSWGNWCDWSVQTFTIYDNEGPRLTFGPTTEAPPIGLSMSRLSFIASIDDSGFGNSRVFGVEWKVTREGAIISDSSDPLAATMVADGNYDETNETVEAIVNVMFWEKGEYTFSIRGYDEYENFGSWNSVDFMLVDDIAPSTPLIVKAIENIEGIRVTWSPNTELDLEGYKIYR
jgi:hypothetical protein